MRWYWLNSDKNCQFCLCHQMKSTDGHMDTNTELSGSCKYFWHKKLKGMKKVHGHRAKEGRQEIFCFTTDELGCKIQNFGWDFFFIWENNFEQIYYVYISFEHVCVSAFGVYSSVPIWIDGTVSCSLTGCDESARRSLFVNNICSYFVLYYRPMWIVL